MTKEGEKKKKIVRKAKAPKISKKIRKKGEKLSYRNIGVPVTPPKERCDDKHCPFHGTLSVRGQIIEGVVISDRMQNTVVVKKDYRRYIPKYERYEWRTGKYVAHNPSCINAKSGSEVKIMECRPLSKTKAFVVIEKKS
ncbi:MAG: 30S ribosomal protein S17 [Methanomassiliicoccales archaeon]|nr:MAG: 30S ribosomal protein S17 [Methanomassiliicoccales archaeon]